MKILFVEDDVRLSAVVADALDAYGYTVDCVHDGESGLLLASEAEYQVIILDVSLPKLDGFSVCQRLRSQGSTVPILMMTACDTTADKVTGLEAGADDYIIKPVDLQEILARVRALQRRAGSANTPVLSWGNLNLDPKTHNVTYLAQPIGLTPKEFALLELFLRSGQRVLSRPLILHHLWHGEEQPSQESVKAHIKGLRQKLKQVGITHGLIETIRGVGYRLKPIA